VVKIKNWEEKMLKEKQITISDIHSRMLIPFINETVITLKEMASFDAHAGDTFKDKVEDFRFKGYAIAARIHGHIEGVILLHNYIETAVAIGNRLRLNILSDSEELTEINEEMQAALAEWGNTAIGRATSTLETLKLGIRFEPPYFLFTTENMAPLLENVKDIMSVPIHIDEVGRFYFNLLVYGSDKKKDAKAEPKIKPAEKILIVDDSKFIRISLRRFFKTLGYENIIEAAHGAEAVEMYAREKPAIIFMDVVMPEMTGDAALEKIRETDKKIPVVMLSSVADQTIIDKCNEIGVSGYIVKPLTAEDGPAKLKEFL
jgi:CheY-like chemotaxis protein/CheY-specific phosphatase CheX